jgi:hypothetical protein
VISAEEPKQPEPVSLISTSSTTVTLHFYASSDNMGAVVTDYTIYRNDGDEYSNWTEIISYSYATNGYIAVIDTATEGMTAGKWYNFVYKATNMIGDSNLSTDLSVPVADQPLQPSAVTLLDHSYTEISVAWTKVDDR